MAGLRPIFVDLLLSLLAIVVAFVIRNTALVFGDANDGFALYLMVGVFVSCLVLWSTGSSRMVWRHFSRSDAITLFWVSLAIAGLTFVIVFSLNRGDGVPRSIPFLHCFALAGLLCAARSAVRLYARRKDLRGKSARPEDAVLQKKHVLIVGVNDISQMYLSLINEHDMRRVIEAVGILDERSVLRGRSIGRTKVVGRPKDLTQIVRMFEIHGVLIDEVVVTVPQFRLSEKTRRAIAESKSMGVTVNHFRERLGLMMSENPATAIASASSENAIPSGYALLKRAIDVVAAVALLALTLPLMGLVAGLVLLDLGSPVLFWQKRTGLHGRQIRIHKFRTLSAGFDNQGKRIPEAKRLSAVGRFLRRSKLDELPQLVNVLFGSMSLIGPRPLLASDQPEGDDYLRRISVRPGLTGWAQVNGGEYIPADMKGRLDSWYVQNMSLKTDLKICLMTVSAILRGGAPPASIEKVDLASPTRSTQHFEASALKSATGSLTEQ